MTRKDLKQVVREIFYEIITEEFTKDILMEVSAKILPLMVNKINQKEKENKYSLVETLVNKADPVKEEIKKNKIFVSEQMKKNLRLNEMPSVLREVMSDTIKDVEEHGFAEEHKSIIDKLEISPQMLETNLKLAGLDDVEKETVEKSDGKTNKKPVDPESIEPMGIFIKDS